MGRSIKPHSITLILALKNHSKHVLIHALMYIRLLCTEEAHRGPFAKEGKKSISCIRTALNRKHQGKDINYFIIWQTPASSIIYHVFESEPYTLKLLVY